MQRDARPMTKVLTRIAAAMGVGVIVKALATSDDAGAQSRGHSIYMTTVGFKGSTTSDKLAPPAIDPKLSKGYTYKFDPSTPQRWEVASYQFSPSSLPTRTTTRSSWPTHSRRRWT